MNIRLFYNKLETLLDVTCDWIDKFKQLVATYNYDVLQLLGHYIANI